GGGGVECRHDDRRGFRVEETVEAGGAVWLRAELQVPLGVQRVLACRDAGQVELIPRAGGQRRQGLERRLRCCRDQQLRGGSEVVVCGAVGGCREAGADDLRGPDRDRRGG